MTIAKTRKNPNKISINPQKNLFKKITLNGLILSRSGKRKLNIRLTIIKRNR